MKRITIFILAAGISLGASAGSIVGAIQFLDGEILLDDSTERCKIGTAAKWSVLESNKVKVGCWGPSDKGDSVLIVWFDQTATRYPISRVVSPAASEARWGGSRGSIRP